jgi:hypothetical protein
MLIENLNLNIQFKGARKYITGSDILQSSLLNIGNCSQLRIDFHNVGKSQLLLNETSLDQIPEIKKNQDLIAIIKLLDIDSKQRLFSVIAQIGTKKIERVEYDESIYTEDTEIKNNSITAKLDTFKLNPIDAIVALNKKLLNFYIEKHPWILVRFDLSQWPIKAGNVQLSLETLMSKNIFRTSIKCEKNITGYIYFSRSNQ